MITDVFLQMLNISGIVSIFALMWLLISTCIKKHYSCKLNYFIWLFMAIRLILFFNVNFPITEEKIYLLPTIITSEDADFLLTNQDTNSDHVDISTNHNTSILNNFTQEMQTTKSTTQVLEIISMIWLIGLCMFLLHQIFSYLLFCKRMHDERKIFIPQNSYDILRNVAKELKYNKKVALQMTNKNTSPMMYGFFHSTIVIVNKEYSSLELEFILKHELLHAKRHDVWYKAILVLAKGIHWFNPLIYIICAKANNDLELACDYDVVQGKSFSYKKSYCTSIVTAIENNFKNNTSLTTHYHGGLLNMKKRIDNIMDRSLKLKGNILSVFIVITFIISSTLIGCKLNDPVKETTPTGIVDVTPTVEPTVTPSEEQSVTPPEGPSTTPPETTPINNSGNSVSDLINSAESVNFQETTRKFAKAYFTRNKEDLSLYLNESVKVQVYENDIWDNLDHFVLKWNPENIYKEGHIIVQYEFRQKEDTSNTYLGIELEKISDEWKVNAYYIEK